MISLADDMDPADMEEFRLIRRYGLTPRQAHILVSVEMRGERPSAVAERLGIGRSAVSEALRAARTKINMASVEDR